MNNKLEDTKYSLIKGKRMLREGNTFYFNYEIIDNITKKVIETVKSWYSVRPLTMDEHKVIKSSELSTGVINEWEPNGLKKANDLLNKMNK